MKKEEHNNEETLYGSIVSDCFWTILMLHRCMNELIYIVTDGVYEIRLKIVRLLQQPLMANIPTHLKLLMTI